MTSLIFFTLDRHIIDGRADHLAFDDGIVKLTYAELLARTAAIAGGLAHVGVREGSTVLLDVQGAALVEAALALARLGALPDAALPDTALPDVGAGFRIAGKTIT